MAEGNDSSKGSSLEQVMENLVLDEESNLFSSVHQDLNFDHRGESRDVSLQSVKFAKNTDGTISKIKHKFYSRLLHIHTMCVDCEVEMNTLIRGLRQEVQRNLELENTIIVDELHETLLLFQPHRDLLKRIMSDIENLMERVLRLGAKT